jgi:hypothetical protein
MTQWIANFVLNKEFFYSQGCDKLEHINVSWCGQITRNGVRILSEECLHLQSFVAKGCTLVSFCLNYRILVVCNGVNLEFQLTGK